MPMTPTTCVVAAGPAPRDLTLVVQIDRAFDADPVTVGVPALR
jgi:hypothetical protein